MIDRWLALISLLLCVVCVVIQYRYQKVPKWLTDAGLVISGIFLGALVYPLVWSTTSSQQSAAPITEPRTIAEIPAVKVHTSLKLQFYGGERVPTEIKKENVLSWYAIWGHPVIAHITQGEGKNKKEFNEVLAPQWWAIMVEFEKPTDFNQILVDSPQNFPIFTVKWATTTYAILMTDFDIPPGIIEIKSND